jgi:archaellum biogenesis ATPase FlaH
MNIKLSTVVNPEYSGTKLNDNDIILGIGSCFAANILTKLLNGGFQGMSNPNGIVYNAVSIAKSLERIVSNKIYSEQDFFFYNNLWHSWEHHGSFSKQILNEAVNLANNSIQKFRNLLESSKCIIITPSSSVVYKHIKTSTITANCHKVPNGEFKRKLLTYSENLNALNNIINFIKK